MNYLKLSNIPTKEIKKYFYNFANTISFKIQYFAEYKFGDHPELDQLAKSLVVKYKFPMIRYFMIFKYPNNNEQLIHVDGIEGDYTQPYTSLNLLLNECKDSSMNFYRGNYSVEHKYFEGFNSSYIKWKSDPELTESFIWEENVFYAVNPSVPHNIITRDNERLTLCIRFSNPKFSPADITAYQEV